MYTKAYRRVMEEVRLLIDELECVEMIHPFGDAVLIIASDEGTLLPNEIKELSNNNALFQYVVGIDTFIDDMKLKKDLFSILSAVVKKVPFTIPDREQYENILSKWELRFE
ncbi:hypothetical protein [Leminorella grimontii]|uniref:hypothetical protein n=1 Tax=Leminorella grimontii TaxID=82981 RepID=UPI0032204D00